jgi:hypothetical protein
VEQNCAYGSSFGLPPWNRTDYSVPVFRCGQPRRTFQAVPSKQKAKTVRFVSNDQLVETTGPGIKISYFSVRDGMRREFGIWSSIVGDMDSPKSNTRIDELPRAAGGAGGLSIITSFTECSG